MSIVVHFFFGEWGMLSRWACCIYYTKIELWKILSVGSSAINKSLSLPEVNQPDD